MTADEAQSAAECMRLRPESVRIVPARVHIARASGLGGLRYTIAKSEF